MWEGAGLRGKFWLLWAFSLCNLKLFPAPETFSFSSAIALVYWSHKCFGRQRKCWTTVEPFPTIWATMKGNGKYRVILWKHAIADFQFDKTDAADANHGQTSSSMKAGDHRSLGRCVQEICSRRNSICCPSFWLQKHVGETCAIDLFTLPSDLLKVDYRKLPVNPKMQSENTRLEGAPLLPLKSTQGMRRWEHQSGPATTVSWTDFCFHKSQTITVHPRTEGWPKGPGLNWDEHLNSQRLARSQHSS